MTDTPGPHEKRAKLNQSLARYDLISWIMEMSRPRPGKSVLDLGCGSGALVQALAHSVGKNGRVTGIDIDQQALASFSDKLDPALRDRVTLVAGDMDEFEDLIGGQTFDAIYSSYAIYYSKDKLALLKRLRHALRAEGTLFVCGPGRDTNREVIELLARFGQEKQQIRDFIDQKDTEALTIHYPGLRSARLANQIRFPSAESYFNWWSNHRYVFAPACSTELMAVVEEEISRTGSFDVTKNVKALHWLS